METATFAYQSFEGVAPTHLVRGKAIQIFRKWTRPSLVQYLVPTSRQVIRCDPLPKDWSRIQRYASWIRELYLDWGENIPEGFLSRLSHNSTDGVLFSNLEQLTWEFEAPRIPLSHFRLFLSSHLKRVTLSTDFIDCRGRPVTVALLPKVISCLPTSLGHLSLECWDEPDEPLRDAISSFVCQCGSFLRSFDTNVPLSKAALFHLMQLPNLRSWVVHEPPQTCSLPPFPSLEELHLKRGALPWLHLLAAHAESECRDGLTPTTATLDTNVKETLKFLTCSEHTPVDSTLLCSISSFRKLVSLHVENDFCEREGTCTFNLTDDDVRDFAVAMPSLVSLRLGTLCSFNWCRTTISSLLSISTHCLGLADLEIHFNTQTVVDDIQHLLNEGSGSCKPRCGLQILTVGYSPLRVDGNERKTVAMGFVDIFPCLKSFSVPGNIGGGWRNVESKIGRSEE